MSDPGGRQPETPDAEQAPEEQPELLPLLTLRDGLPEVVETDEALAACCAAVAAGTGPVAIDAERASGYRYSQRAYLIQLRREGSGSWLIDPIAFDDLDPLQEAIGDAEWILHAATQDLACLHEVGLHPSHLFDTELAARLLGYPKVGLAALVEVVTGRRMKKEHSASDWSKRPLPEAYLEYAALDVEVLLEIREHLIADLEAAGKTEWARQDFEALLDFAPAVRVDPWRRTSQMHRAKGRRAVAAVRELWTARDALASQRDVTPGRIIPDAAIIAAANALPSTRDELLAVRGFHGRGAGRYADRWLAALETARTLPDKDLPPTSLRSDGPPPPRAWADRDPIAAGRLTKARAALAALSEERSVPVENLLTPDTVRRVLWQPPPGEGEELRAGVAERLAAAGARPWQVELVGPILIDAIEQPEPPQRPADADEESNGS